MLIKIISGTYGNVENGAVVPKNADSTPFELSAEDARRLISLGVAERADGSASAPEAESVAPEGITLENYSVDNTKAELTELLGSIGIEAPAGLSKAKLVAMVDEAIREMDARDEAAGPHIEVQQPV